MADWKDILSNEEDQVNDEELMKYLDGNLSEEEKNSFEKKTANSDFINDAVEGLNQFKNKRKLDEYVNQLNKNLHDQLSNRKARNEKRRIKDNPWIPITVILILSLCLLAYIVIHTYYKGRNALPVYKTQVINFDMQKTVKI